MILNTAIVSVRFIFIFMSFYIEIILLWGRVISMTFCEICAMNVFIYYLRLLQDAALVFVQWMVFNCYYFLYSIAYILKKVAWDTLYIAYCMPVQLKSNVLQNHAGPAILLQLLSYILPRYFMVYFTPEIGWIGSFYLPKWSMYRIWRTDSKSKPTRHAAQHVTVLKSGCTCF